MIYCNSKNVSRQRMEAEIITLKDKVQAYQERYHSMEAAWKSSEKGKLFYKEECSKKDAIIKELTNKVAYLVAISGHDGTNTGIPTAATPLNKKKVIPNSRRRSGKKKGGQAGHERHTMERFKDSEITQTVTHSFDPSEESCRVCGGELVRTGETISKDEFDVEIKVVKRRHHYEVYQCAGCGDTVHMKIDKNLKEENQYGPTVQALSLSMMVTGNVAINKVQMLVQGMTGGLMRPSEGFICKLYKKAAGRLLEFMSDLKKKAAYQCACLLG